MTRHVLEACVQSADGAVAAEQGGADRIELNTALRLGGLTPTGGLVREVLRGVSIPVVAMLRPREGDFCCSDREFQVMLRDAEMLLDAGVHGIAFGILSPAGTIDSRRTRELVDVIAPRAETVFHRAFDHTPDAMQSLEVLKDLGVTRVLTSGLAATAAEGAECLARLHEAGGSRIQILAAGSIRPHNAADLVQRTGITQVHAALTTRRGASDARTASDSISLGVNDDGGYLQTSESLVREMRLALDRL